MAGDEEREVQEQEQEPASAEGEAEAGSIDALLAGSPENAGGIDALLAGGPEAPPGRRAPTRPDSNTEKALGLEVARLLGMSPRTLMDPQPSPPAAPRPPATDATEVRRFHLVPEDRMERPSPLGAVLIGMHRANPASTPAML